MILELDSWQAGKLQRRRAGRHDPTDRSLLDPIHDDRPAGDRPKVLRIKVRRA